MPKNVVIYRVFLASPNDVKDVRVEARKVIDLFNQIHSDDNIKIELVSWENSTHPAFGEYPQAVVSTQIGNDYDIFVGILWTRFGTPTPKYESGTEEEFFGAYNRLRSGDNIGIMIYRKDTSIPPSKIDTNQLQKINDFVSKVNELGGYYFLFKTKKDFHDFFLKHLDETIKDLKKKGKKSDNIQLKQDEIEASREINTDDKNWGLLEYIDFIINTCEEVTISINCISNLTQEIGQKIQQYTQEINTMQRNPNALHMKSILINVARDMNKYAKEVEIPNRNWYEKYFELQKATKEMLEVSEGLVSVDEWEGFVDNMRNMSREMGGAYSAMRQLYTSVNTLPKISQPLNVARINVCNKLKNIISNIKDGKQYCDDTIEFIEETIHPINE